jgi:ABC-type glutathione transport system ATPase component
MSEQMLQVKDLTMHYKTSKGEVSAVNNVSFNVQKGQSLGLVGESGCGKTSIAFSLLRLLPDNANIKGGSIVLDGEDIASQWSSRPR